MGVLVTLSDNLKLCLLAGVPSILVMSFPACYAFYLLWISSPLTLLCASRSSRLLCEYLSFTHLPRIQGHFLRDAQIYMLGTMRGRGLFMLICTDVTRNMVKTHPDHVFTALCGTYTNVHRSNSEIRSITSVDRHAYRSSWFVALDTGMPSY